MPASKLKNLAVLILLLANLALLALLIPGRLAQAEEQEALRRSLSQLCAAQDVTLNPSVIPQDVTLYALELAEDPEADLKAATALLGQDAAAQSTSNRYLRAYESPLGQCKISQTGVFQASLTNQPQVRDLTAAAKKLLRQMGFSASKFSAPLQQTNTASITATQTVLDVPVFSGGLTLTYTDNRLTSMSGVFFNGTGSLTRISEDACCSAADAVVAFLSNRYDLGWVGSEITALEQGYIRSETAAAAALHLTPVWRITTDTGEFYVNGLTAEISAVH